MLTKNNLPLLIVIILCAELLIWSWAFFTSTLSTGNFFAIEPEFIYDKSARNSGRISSALNIIILLMIGYSGLKQIYADDTKKDRFRIMITLFAVNHLTHFFFVFQTFKHHTTTLSISENIHGFVTFICILVIPVMLWKYKKLTRALYFCIILHLLNVSYFIMETFYNKITAEKPAYHNQFGIAVTTAACIFVLFRVLKESKLNSEAGKLPHDAIT